MSGLSAADRLRQLADVVILEAGPSAGGLARAVKVGGEPIEAYYHHIFPQDLETRALLDRLDLADRLDWHLGRMGILAKGGLYRFDTPLDLLRFPLLPVPSRFGLGAATAAQLVRRDQAALDRRPVGSRSSALVRPRGIRRPVASVARSKVRSRAPRRCPNGLAGGSDPTTRRCSPGRRRQAWLLAGESGNPGRRLRPVARRSRHPDRYIGPCPATLTRRCGMGSTFEFDGTEKSIRVGAVVAALAGPSWTAWSTCRNPIGRRWHRSSIEASCAYCSSLTTPSATRTGSTSSNRRVGMRRDHRAHQFDPDGALWRPDGRLPRSLRGPRERRLVRDCRRADAASSQASAS